MQPVVRQYLSALKGNSSIRNALYKRKVAGSLGKLYDVVANDELNLNNQLVLHDLQVSPEKAGTFQNVCKGCSLLFED